MKKPIIKIEYDTNCFEVETVNEHATRVWKELKDDYHVLGVLKPYMDITEVTDTQAIYHIDGNSYTPEEIIKAVELVYGSKKSNE